MALGHVIEDVAAEASRRQIRWTASSSHWPAHEMGRSHRHRFAAAGIADFGRSVSIAHAKERA
jgi:hypothetical protein